MNRYMQHYKRTTVHIPIIVMLAVSFVSCIKEGTIYGTEELEIANQQNPVNGQPSVKSSQTENQEAVGEISITIDETLDKHTYDICF